VAQRERPAADAGDVVREVRIAAPADVVFAYFMDPARIVRWIGEHAEIEPRVGGVFRVRMADGNVTSGELVELDPPRRLAFTWGWEGGGPVPPGSSTVEVELTPDGDGTLVRLTHRGLPDEARALHQEGWDRFLPALASVAGAQRDETGGE